MFLNKIKKPEPHNIAFIFGCARGGTTWLWSLLESHEQVKPFLLQKKSNTNNVYETSESGIYFRKPKQAAKEIKKFARRFPNNLIIEKTPFHTLIHKKIITDFPKSSNIIILRHPIAIVNSILMSEMRVFKNFDIDSSISLVKEYYKNLIELCDNKNTAHIVRYEDLLSNTEKNLNSLFIKFNLDLSTTNKIIDENFKKSKIGISGVFRKGEAKSYLNELENDRIIYLENNLNEEILFFNSWN
ncbi:sulfotransferase family protein [Zunongwangia pacifica]|uniref:Sulfotransferase n=1 Tax=Zunongwangia pacifica TaxID=2911062 RepID=A0A9X2CNX3_9FLAO|nr:sulfotransferase [Zunongwangia pacifica]MCL6219179.1 sulfotransferase [Zunongwangia pacifica]